MAGPTRLELATSGLGIRIPLGAILRAGLIGFIRRAPGQAGLPGGLFTLSFRPDAGHAGQNPLVRQENITSRSSAQSGHRIRAIPLRGLPKSRYFSTTSLTIGRKKPSSFASRLRTAKPVLPLETTLILRQKPVEMMEEYPIKDCPLRMSRTIDSRHSRRKASRTGPMSWIGPRLHGKRR